MPSVVAGKLEEANLRRFTTLRGNYKKNRMGRERKKDSDTLSSAPGQSRLFPPTDWRLRLIFGRSRTHRDDAGGDDHKNERGSNKDVFHGEAPMR
jgi:hypothetical protein